MGQRQDKTEIIYGNNCLTCFEEGETPLYVYARFSKIEKCTLFDPDICKIPPNDRVFKLTQIEGEPCRWRYLSDTFRVFLRMAGEPPGENYLILDDNFLSLYFRAFFDECPEEGTVFDNDLPACGAGHCGTDGIAVLTWRLETLLVMELLNIKPQKDLFMEMRPLDDGARVYKFCKLSQGMNIAVKYDP